MNSLLQRTTGAEPNQQDNVQIGVYIQGVTELELSKLRRILQLSATRKRHYLDVNADSVDQASIVITTEQNPVVKEHQVVVSYGKQASNYPHHLQAPFISIRVLRMLDGIELKGDPLPTTIITPDEQVTSEAPQVAPVRSEIIPAADDVPSYRILIVDDSVLIHKALDIELAKAPFVSNKDYAESGEECLTLVKQTQYEMIFLDVMMPGIDGFETCSEIRKIAGYRKVPIIMLSAKTSPLDEVKGVMAGCTTYLTKPIQHDAFQKLLGRMGNWLENYKSN